MKNLLNILGVISLITTGSGNLTACKNNTNQKNKESPNEDNHKQTEKPPENSNWKLDNNPNFINYKFDNKSYIAIFKYNTKDWYIINFLNNSRNDKILGEFSFDGVRKNIYLSDLINYFERGDVKTVYCWNGDGVGEPETPIIDKNTGKIINWK